MRRPIRLAGKNIAKIVKKVPQTNEQLKKEAHAKVKLLAKRFR